MSEKNQIRRVLVLEDEPIISRVLLRILKVAGLEADIANNGLSAREMIDAGTNYDAFIFDIKTPIISGIQLYEYMEEFFPDMTGKVIFTTGDYLNTVTCTFLERVKRPFLAKPFTPDQLMNLVEQVFQSEFTAV